MTKILGVGIATLDIINTVAEYPDEDSEVRAIHQTIKRGGNATNSLVILSQLGHQCYWAGTLANETDADHIIDDLDKYRINHQYAKTYSTGKVPTSYILLNESNGSRSIVHYRDLPELSYKDFKEIPLEGFDWIHFEGRNTDQTLLMLQHVKEKVPHTLCSLEIEKHCDNIEQLYPYADALIFSKAFCQQSPYKSADIFLNKMHLTYPDKTLILAWGDQGSYAVSAETVFFHSPAVKPESVTDTLGAGDTFNAGLINALIKNKTIEDALYEANKLASIKIAVNGFDLTTDEL